MQKNLTMSVYVHKKYESSAVSVIRIVWNHFMITVVCCEILLTLWQESDIDLSSLRPIQMKMPVKSVARSEHSKKKCVRYLRKWHKAICLVHKEVGAFGWSGISKDSPLYHKYFWEGYLIISIKPGINILMH